MPDTDLDKPGKNPKPSGSATGAPGSGADAAPASLEEELDRLLADIEVAVDELDPLGDLEEQAAAAKDLANAGDPTYDEIEDKYEVIAPGATEEPTEEASPEPEATTESGSADDLDAELDDLIESISPEVAASVASDTPDATSTPAPPAQALDDGGTFKPDPQKKLNEEQSQIDHELDALLAEAGALVDDEDTTTEEAEIADAPVEEPDTPAVEATDEVSPEAVVAEPEPTPEAEVSQDEPVEEVTPSETVETATETSEAVVDETPEPVVEDAPPQDAEAVITDATNAETDQVEAPEAGPASPDSAEVEAEPTPDRSIEDIDADLAAKAETVVADAPEAEDEPGATSEGAAEQTGDEAFRSSDDVVEEVIDQHASAVQTEAEGSDEDADALAQLMAESPASAEMGVAPAQAKPESGQAQQPSPSTEPATSTPAAEQPAATPAGTPPQPTPTPQDARPSRLAPLFRLAGFARPVALRVARVLSKPLELVPPKVRDDIGWLSLVTMFLAMAVMVALALFR